MSPLTPEPGDVAAYLDRIRAALERLGRQRTIELLQWDDDEFAALAARLNSEADYWQE